MDMLKIQSVIVVLFLLGVLDQFTKASGDVQLDLRQLNLVSGLNKAEVELLIVCDVECFDRFQWDRQKLIDYWYVYMWDVNMRFKTLPSVDISFRVTSILTADKIEDQPFVENARTADGTITLKSVWKGFGDWVYSKEKELPAFDVALLVTGAKQEAFDEYLAYEQSDKGGTACLKNDSAKTHLSTIVLHSTATWGYHCASLEASLAEILGAKYDLYTDCSQQDYLMTSLKCNNNQYAFSSCSNDAIASFVEAPQAACLRSSEAPEVDVLKETTVTHAPSLNDQCVMITGNNRAVALSAEEEHHVEPCVISKCSVYDNGNWTFLRWLFPVDNSLCGGGKVCFRGRCLSQGVQLQNVETGMCIKPNKRFGKLELPNVVNCHVNPSPLDQVRILDEQKTAFGNFLATPTTIPSVDLRDEDECLSSFFDYENTSHVEYSSCLTTDEDYIGWDFVGLGAGNDDFLLQHRFTDSCAKVDADNIIRVYKECDADDVSTHWTLLKSPLIPLNVVGSSILLPSGFQIDPRENNFEDGVGKIERTWYQSGAVSIAIQIVAYSCIVIVCAFALYSVHRYIRRRRSGQLVEYQALTI